jgi:hypothetical protein
MPLCRFTSRATYSTHAALSAMSLTRTISNGFPLRSNAGRSIASRVTTSSGLRRVAAMFALVMTQISLSTGAFDNDASQSDCARVTA